MKKLRSTITFLVLTMIMSLLPFEIKVVDSQATNATEGSQKLSQPAFSCPAGQRVIGFENGRPVCRYEPTGCPYGDSIPLKDCQKHAPKKNKAEPMSPSPKPYVNSNVSTGVGK